MKGPAHAVAHIIKIFHRADEIFVLHFSDLLSEIPRRRPFRDGRGNIFHL
jgi:hypothetical protein